MATLQVDISNIAADIRTFPNAALEAKVLSAELDVARSSGAPLIRLEYEIYHPTAGTTKLRDTLPSNFPAKVKSFWMAVNDFSAEEMAEQPKVDIDPDTLVGATIIVQLGEQENKESGRVYKTVVAPWYYPISRVDLLEISDDENPFN